MLFDVAIHVPAGGSRVERRRQHLRVIELHICHRVRTQRAHTVARRRVPDAYAVIVRSRREHAVAIVDGHDTVEVPGEILGRKRLATAYHVECLLASIIQPPVVLTSVDAF